MPRFEALDMLSLAHGCPILHGSIWLLFDMKGCALEDFADGCSLSGLDLRKVLEKALARPETGSSSSSSAHTGAVDPIV